MTFETKVTVATRALVAVTAIFWTTTGPSAQTIGISTMQPGTLNHSSGAAIAKVVQQKTGLQVRIQPSSGETTLLPLVHMKEADFGLANALEVSEAFTGSAVSAGKQDSLRVVAAVYPIKVGFYARKDSGMKDVEELKGKRVPVGYSAQRAVGLMARAIFATGGIDEKSMRPVSVPNVIRSADDFISGAADVFFFALGAGKVSEANASVGGIRLLGIKNTPEALSVVRRVNSSLYLSEVKPHPGLAGVVEPTSILTVDNLLVAGAHVSDEIIDRVLTAITENKEDLVATAPWLGEFKANDYYKASATPYHPAAIKWFAQHGIEQAK